MRRLVEVYVSGAVEKPFYDDESRRLRERANGLDRELRKIESLAVSVERIIASTDTIEKLYEQYRYRVEAASDEQKREIFQTFIKAVVVHDEDLEIEVSLPSLDSFAEQGTHRLFRKDAPPLFLKTRLLPVNEIFRKIGLHRNFRKSVTKKAAA